MAETLGVDGLLGAKKKSSIILNEEDIVLSLSPSLSHARAHSLSIYIYIYIWGVRARGHVLMHMCACTRAYIHMYTYRCPYYFQQ